MPGRTSSVCWPRRSAGSSSACCWSGVTKRTWTWTWRSWPDGQLAIDPRHACDHLFDSLQPVRLSRPAFSAAGAPGPAFRADRGAHRHRAAGHAVAGWPALGPEPGQCLPVGGAGDYRHRRRHPSPAGDHRRWFAGVLPVALGAGPVATLRRFCRAGLPRGARMHARHPHPALRATLTHRDVANAVLPPATPWMGEVGKMPGAFSRAGAASRREKGIRRASLRDFHVKKWQKSPFPVALPGLVAVQCWTGVATLAVFPALHGPNARYMDDDPTLAIHPARFKALPAVLPHPVARRLQRQHLQAV